MRVRSSLVAASVVCLVALLQASIASGVAPRNGWGFGVGDDDWNLVWADVGDPGSIPYALEDKFALLGPKVFRLQVEWNAATSARLLHRARTIISRARASGVQQVLVTFKRNSYTDVNGTSPSVTDYEIQVARVVRALAADVDAWGPANEPNGGVRWLPDVAGAEKLADYMASLEEVVSTWDATALTTSPDFVDRKDLGSIATYINAYKGADGTFGDYAAWHPYWGVNNRSNGALSPTTQTTQDFIGLLPAGKSIWITEVGSFGRNLSDGVNDDLAVDQNARTFWLTNTLANMSRVSRVYYYHMRGSGNPSSSWDTGLLGPDGRPRMAWYTWCIASHGDDFNHPDCRIPATEPSATSKGGNWVGLVARNSANGVGFREWTTSSGWSNWTLLGGDAKGKPRVISWGAGHADVYVRGGDDRVYHRYRSGGQWSGWEGLGTNRITSDPVPVAWSDSRVDLFARAPGGELLHSYFDGSQWRPWEVFGGVTFVGNPGVMSWGAGHLGVFVRGTDGQMYQKYFVNGQWSNWDNLAAGWIITSDPNPLSWGYGHVDVFARGSDGGLVHRWFDQGQWYPWENLGAGWKISTAPSPVSWASGQLSVFARGTNGALAHRWYGNGQWQPWENLGGVIQDQPAPVAVASGHLDVFGAGTDNAVWHIWYGGSQWHPWDTLGSP